MITSNKTNLYKRIASSFLVLSLLIGIAIFYIAFSWAAITITPKAENFSASYAMDVVDVSQNQTSAPVVPGRVIEDDLEGDGTFSSTGVEKIDQRPGGKLTVVNTTDKDQQLRATTRFLTSDNVLFRLQDYALVPAKGQVEVEIYADAPGDLPGPVSSRLTIPGLWEGLQDKIYGQGYTPLQEGVGKNKLVTKDDIQKAQDSLVKRLEQSFSDKVQKDDLYQKSNGQIQSIISHNVATAVANRKEGDKAEQFNLRVKVHFTAVLFNEPVLQSQLKTKLSERLGPNQELIAPQAHQLRYELGRLSPDHKGAIIKVSASAGKILKQDTRLVDKEQLTWLSADEIKAHFSSQDDVQGVEVQLYPFWITRTPLITDHINILIKR